MLLPLIYEDMRTNRGSGNLTRLILLGYRLGHWCIGRGGARWDFYRVLTAVIGVPYRLLQAVAGCSLPFSASVGQRLHLPHGFFGVFVAASASIGDDVVMLHQVTIGSNYGSSSPRSSPQVGDGVFIGVGAKIIGGVVIGQSAKIGANALVVKDVEAGAVVVAPIAYVLDKGPVL